MNIKLTWPRVFKLRICQIKKDDNFAGTVRTALVTDTGCVELLNEPQRCKKGKREDRYIWQGAEVKVRDADCMQSLIARASASGAMLVRPRLVA